MKDKISKILTEYTDLAGSLETCISKQIEPLSLSIIECLERGNKVMLAGNGGSAAEATHIAAEFTGRFKLERPGWAAISLSTDTSAITAISNDYSFEDIFSRQIEALGQKGDVLIALSTSGNSTNILKAVTQASSMGIKTIALTGGTGGGLKGRCNQEIFVPSNNTPRIQEVHLLVLHTVCELVEASMVSSN